MNTTVRAFLSKTVFVLTLVITLTVLSATFAFAAPNQALQSITANIQEAVSSPSANALEGGVEFLSGSTGLRVVEFSAGGHHALAILSDGTLWAWGRNNYGQLGINATSSALVPTQVGTLNTWTSISAGQNHSTAIQSNGTLWAWGQGTSGRLGLGSYDSVSVPTQVQPGTTWRAIEAAPAHTLAIQSNGTMWSWGSLPGEQDHVLLPLQVGTVNTWQSIASDNNHFLAIQNNGTLWAWGAGGAGQLGLGDTDARFVPTQVQPGTTWRSVAAGNTHTLGIQSNGTLWAWGGGAGGQLGLGDVNGRYVPTQVGTANTWSSVSARFGQSLATQNNGTLWGWGANGDGQLGIGSTTNALVPTQAGNLTTWESVSAGQWFSLAIQNNGTIWSYGWGDSGRTGLGNIADANVPTLVHAQVSASTPAANATNVPTTTNSITLTFNRVMDEDFGNVTVSGATVNMAGATWVHGTNTSTLTVPITLTLPGGNIHTVSAPGLFTTPGGFAAVGADAPNAGPGVFPAVGHSFSFTTELPDMPMQDTLTKTLRLPANTTIPTLAFDFTFTPAQVTLSTNPTISSVPAASVPSISTQTITFNSSSTHTEASGIRTASQNIDLFNLVNALTFPHAGTFVWNIEEVQTTPTVTAPSHLDFSQARYEMRVLVDRELNVAAIELFVRVVDTNTQTVGSKVPVALFTNTYTTTVSNPLSVQKVTTGQFANHGLDFNFTLTLTNPALGGPIGNVTANVVDINTPATTLRTVPITVGANTFTLSHNERLVIPTLPAGTTFSITEAAATEYIASAVITIGGTVQGTPPTYSNTLPNTALTTGTYTIASSGTNSANFTNAHQFTPPTGLSIANAPYILAILAVVGITLLAVARKRKKIEELPVV